MTRETVDLQDALALRVVSSELGVEVLEWPIKFPADAGERARINGLLQWLLRAQGLQASAFLQVSAMHLGAGALLPEHYERWMPDLGTAYWSARKPPALLTLDDMYTLDPDKPVVIPGQHVMRVSKAEEIMHCVETMAGYGALVVALCHVSEQAFLTACREYYEPQIQEPAFKALPMYCPILDRAAMQAPVESLRAWLPGVGIYVRESIEDQSLLIVSLQPLIEPLLRAGARRSEQAKDRLQIPARLLRDAGESVL